MKARKTALVCCLVAAGGLAIESRAEVVMLRSGSLIEGRIEHQGDAVLVRQGGDSIRLQAEEVVYRGESRLAIYQQLRNQPPGEDTIAGKHLRLANWAMVNDLLPQAALELLEARTADPRDRRLAVLERRLDELVRLASQPAKTNPPKPARTPAVSGEPIQPHSLAYQQEPLPNLPADGLAHFTREIQPLLLNGCTDCHRGEPGDMFPLDPTGRHGHGNAKSTDHNLRTALAALDLGSPAASRLLAAARGPHAGVTPLSGPRHDELVQRLADWAQSVGTYNVADLPPPPVRPSWQPQQLSATPQQTVGAFSPRVPVEPEYELASYDEVGEQEVLAPFGSRLSQPVKRGDPAAAELEMARLKNRLRGEPEVDRVFKPRDEFDPAIFNKRFRRPEDDLPLSEPVASR